MSQKIDKDKLKALQEKYQLLLADLLRLEENKYCVDCDAKGPRWASWNLGVFLCIRCAGIHRNLGVHVSRVKSVNLDSWTPEQIAVVQEVGNAKGRAIYEANLPENFRRPQTDSAMEALIRAKYEHKKYVSRDWLPSQQQPKAVSSVQEQAKKEKKRSKSSLGEQAVTHERSLGNVKNASDSNLVGSRLAERRERSEPSASTAATPNRKVKETTSENLPPIELISLASPEQNFDATEFGSFVTAPSATVSTSSTAAATAAVGNGASSDLAELDPFPGSSAVNTSQPVAGSSNGSATGSSMQATKEDILALFGPSSTAGMFGVPGGGMYVQRQPVMCQTGGMQQAPMMPTGLPMMQPMMAMGPVMQPVNGPMTQVPVAPAGYGLYQGYPQAQMQQMTPGAGVVWCPTQQVVQPAQQQLVAGHTLSNVLWQ